MLTASRTYLSGSLRPYVLVSHSQREIQERQTADLSVCCLQINNSFGRLSFLNKLPSQSTGCPSSLSERLPPMKKTPGFYHNCLNYTIQKASFQAYYIVNYEYSLSFPLVFSYRHKIFSTGSSKKILPQRNAGISPHLTGWFCDTRVPLLSHAVLYCLVLSFGLFRLAHQAGLALAANCDLIVISLALCCFLIYIRSALL